MSSERLNALGIALLMPSMDNSNISTMLYRNVSTAFENPTIHTKEYPAWMHYKPSCNQNVLSQQGIFKISGYSRFEYLVYIINKDVDVATDISRCRKVEMLLRRPKMPQSCFVALKQL